MRFLPPAPTGAAPGSFTVEEFYNRITKFFARNEFYSLTTDPTGTEIKPGSWALYKNTTSGDLKLWANDGGTLKSITLT